MTLKVHQALHGYSEGHRQLACSTSLPTKDARLLLVMSDVSGPGVASLGLPYITGYPLPESGLYALAKTWPAPEMPRPGCVWTHTLLIGFADLAVLPSPSLVAKLFQRPSSEVPFSFYLQEAALDLGDQFGDKPLSPDGKFWFERLATALYERAGEQVWARRTDDQDIDDAVLRLWDQQWPRLKRTFKFCTLSSRDRSQDGMQFDLQLSLAGESSSHMRFSSTKDGFEANAISHGAWLEDLIHDAQFPRSSTLRQFLRKLGADILGGREAMRPFCDLHAALVAAGPEGISDAVTRVERTPIFSTSELVRSIVLRAALDKLSSLDDHVLTFVVANFHLLAESEAREYQNALAQLLWLRSPRQFIGLGHEARMGVTEAVRAGANSIPIAEVLRQLPEVDDLIAPLLELLPALAEEPEFWSTTQVFPAIAANSGIDVMAPDVLRAMVLGLRESGPIHSALQVIGAATVIRCIQDLIASNEDFEQLEAWLRYASVDTDAVAGFLSEVSSPSRQLLTLLARLLGPDAVPNDFGDDPWCAALEALQHIDGQLPIELQVYGFRRALGWRSRNVEGLLKLCFEPLHAAAEKRAIPEALWNTFERTLPHAPYGQDWDHAIRLRRATARKCYELQLRPQGMASLVSSDPLFLQLVDEIWAIWGGPRYVRSVSDALQDSPVDRDSHRARLLKIFVKRHKGFWS